VQYRVYEHKGDTGHKVFLGPNPPEGALLTYFLKAKPGEKEKVSLSVKDASGEVVRELKDIPREAGLNRASWDLRHEPPVPASDLPSFFGPPRGPLVPPGAYTITLSVGERTASGAVTVEADPRLSLSPEQRADSYAAARAAARLWGRTNAANKRLGALKKQLKELREPKEGKEKADAPLPQAVADGVKALLDKVDPLARQIDRDAPLGFAGAPLEDDPVPLLLRTRGLHLAFSQITAPPTPQQRDLLARLEKETATAMARVNALFDEDVAALNRLMLENGMGRLDAGRKVE
jgi:hypothetical protein